MGTEERSCRPEGGDHVVGQKGHRRPRKETPQREGTPQTERGDTQTERGPPRPRPRGVPPDRGKGPRRTRVGTAQTEWGGTQTERGDPADQEGRHLRLSEGVDLQTEGRDRGRLKIGPEGKDLKAEGDVHKFRKGLMIDPQREGGQ